MSTSRRPAAFHRRPSAIGTVIGSTTVLGALCDSADVPRLASIEPSVLRVDDDGVTLLGGWSATSGMRHFPRSSVCPFTGADDVEPVDLPRTGTVWLHTTVHLAPPGYSGPVPYGLGVVELDDDPTLRIVTRLQGDALSPGTSVHLDGEEIPGPDGQTVVTWVFHP